MSQVIFNSYIDLANQGATPSGIGYTVAYDLDGILKQKNEDGVITPISSSQDLRSTLAIGNISGTYSILMGTGSTIGSVNGTGKIALDYGTTSSVAISASSSSATASVIVSPTSVYMGTKNGNATTNTIITPTTFGAYAGTPTYSTYIEHTGLRFTLGHNDTNIGSNGKILVIDSGKTYDNVGSINKAYLHLNTFGSTTQNGVRNSVIIGGFGLTASTSNTVYLGNKVNINNAYTLPSTDGLNNQILTTNGGGTVSWATFSVGAIPLSAVLSVGSYSATYSILLGPSQSYIMGTNSTLSSINSPSIVSLDNGSDKGVLISTNGIGATQGIISLATASLYTQAQSTILEAGTFSVTTYDGQGIKYKSDYSAGFVNESLVTKRYVDSNSGSYLTHLVAYVDPENGNDLTGSISRPNKPYKTISAAMLGVTSSSYSSQDRGMIHLRRGIYTDIARLENNVDYYAESGVVFTQNGFRDFSAVSSNVYGNVAFKGTDSSLIPLYVSYASTINFYFDSINSKQAIGRIIGTGCQVYMTGNSIITNSETGFGLSLEGSANLNLKVRGDISGAYEVIYAKPGYSGNTIIEAQNIYSDGSTGSSGIVSNSVHAVRVASGNVTINANIFEKSPTTAGNNSAILIESGNVIINGNLIGGKSKGLYLSDGGWGTVSVTGAISSTMEAIYNVNNFANLRISDSLIMSSGLGTFTQSIYMGASSSIYISNSTIYNSLSDSSIIYTSRLESMIGLYNVLAYSPGTGGDFILCTYSGYSTGLHNVRSNKDNSANIIDTFDPSGFIYDPFLFVPNF